MTQTDENASSKQSQEMNPRDLIPNYLSGLSHDIRTPLSAIIGFSELLVEPRISRAEQRNYSYMIARSSRKLLDLMSNLIDLAKMDTNHLELFYKPVVIKDLIEEVKIEIDELAHLYEKKHLEITYTGPKGSMATMVAEKSRIFQIIKILMENSLRYTKEGSVSLSIRQEEGSPDYIIEIIDTGAGMDRATLSILFEMFPPRETPIGQKMKTRGMSMAVVKKLCDRMGVGIEVFSQLGSGTRVRMTVPPREA